MTIHVANVLLENLEKSAQTRASLDESRIEDLAAYIQEGGKLDPAKVILCGCRLILSDGYHRAAAYERAGQTEMLCEIIDGSEWDALVEGIKSNNAHRGKPPTRADIRHSIEVLLEQNPNVTDPVIAGIVGCTAKTVAAKREALEAIRKIPVATEKTGADGRTWAHKEKRVTPKARKVNGCPRCESEWVNDSHSVRYCPVCGFHDLWDAHPLPEELDPQYSYFARGVFDDWACYDPVPGHPGYWFRAHFRNVGSENPIVDASTCGSKYERGVQEELLRRSRFWPATTWMTLEATNEVPLYVPVGEVPLAPEEIKRRAELRAKHIAELRAEGREDDAAAIEHEEAETTEPVRWKIERESLAYFGENGRFPTEVGLPAIPDDIDTSELVAAN